MDTFDFTFEWTVNEKAQFFNGDINDLFSIIENKIKWNAAKEASEYVEYEEIID